MIFDTISLLATVKASENIKALERELDLRGFTWGYKPARAAKDLKAILDAGIPNLLAERYGEIDDICMSLKVETPDGVIQTKQTPRSATGPDLKKIFIGSQGRYGKILEATLRLSPVPAEEITIRCAFSQNAAKLAFLKCMGGSGIRPAILKEVKAAKPKLLISLQGLVPVVRAERDWIMSEVGKFSGKASL